MRSDWDYLIVTASNDRQAETYRQQLGQRCELGLLQGCRQVLVVPDLAGKRMGSGGSTLLCLMEVLSHELRGRDRRISTPQLWLETLRRLRVLIVHAGGDSKRLPAYGPCGKIFVPMPGESDSCLPLMLLDRQLPTYLALPACEEGLGQVVITSGDVLLRFDPMRVRFDAEGITGLACGASLDQASRHGVFCCGENGRVRRFLQKPSPAEQQAAGAVDAYGRVALDIGVMNLPAEAAVRLLDGFGVQLRDDGRFELSGELGRGVDACGLDFYREICCEMGDDTTKEDYICSVQRAGSRWDSELLGALFDAVSEIPLHAYVLPSCEFLHFGTNEQVISSGNYVLQQDNGYPSANTMLCLNTQIGPAGWLSGVEAWVEGCRIMSTVTLEGQNLLVGVDVEQPLSLPTGACVDVIAGRMPNGDSVWFARVYGIRDTFQGTSGAEAVFCGMKLDRWLEAVQTGPDQLWSDDSPPEERTLWHARLFPGLGHHAQYRDWLWMLDPRQATDEQRGAWRSADRYSFADIASLACVEAFHERRESLHIDRVLAHPGGMFARESGFSASDLAKVLQSTDKPQTLLHALIAEARCACENRRGSGIDSLVFPRMMHTLGSAMQQVDAGEPGRAKQLLCSLTESLPPDDGRWLASLGLRLSSGDGLQDIAQQAHATAFTYLGRAILSGGSGERVCPRARLRSDEIVWGRAPARLDTGGGWTDTPPYSLEHGGCVVNTAVNLNGQPPIQAYLRIINKPIVRIGSIDLGTRIDIHSLDELLDYRQPDSEYGLAKAALALSGFSPETAPWPDGIQLEHMLELFGGGIELTTLAAVPKGSGLGTSSIMGAVLLAVIGRAMGREYTQRELFYEVLQLEQLLTTGGGWQDQIGGVVGGCKSIATEPGLVPDARIEYLVGDVLDPSANGGLTLLYYTGITRLAKGILGQVVGHYLDRDRTTVATLGQIHALAPRVAEAISHKDGPAFGQLVGQAWELNKQLDPGSTNDQVEGLVARIKRHVHGAKLLGAGGGGFLLMACRSCGDASHIREMLTVEPPNRRARFFDYQINYDGLIVTAC